MNARADRGSISVWVCSISIAMVILVGVAVDLTGQVRAQQHARDIAAQAARAAGQQIDAATAIRGRGARANPGPAVAAAQAYLRSADITGTATVVGGDTVVVTTATTYTPRFLSIIGIGDLAVTGRAEARIVRVGGTP